MDSSKAFDRVNFWHLFRKLLDRGLPDIIVRFLMYWFIHQQFRVRWCYVLSEPFTSSNGVRQGGILSPLLFNLYMDDLSRDLKNANVGCYMNSECINHLFYADDSVLLAPSPSALQQLIDTCASYALSNEITFNSSKTVCMHILPKWLKCHRVPHMYLTGNCLKWTEKQKYLGIIMNSCFNDCNDISRQIKAIYARGNALICKFRDCTYDVKVQLFKSFCTSFYCSSLWFNYNTVIFNRLRVAYNNVFRSLMKIGRGESISLAFMNHRVNCFYAVMRKSITSFRSRLYSCDNFLIKSCISSQFHFYKSKIVQQWNSLIL